MKEPRLHLDGVQFSICSTGYYLDSEDDIEALQLDDAVSNLQTLVQTITPQLFAASLFPYIGFLYYLTIARKASGAPTLMVGGFYFLLVFVGATIPAGIYAKTVYGTSLANVDWLHGTAESLLTVTNLLIGAQL